jgi:hypothetical protein
MDNKTLIHPLNLIILDYSRGEMAVAARKQLTKLQIHPTMHFWLARPEGENAGGGVEDVLDVFYCKYMTASAFL